MNKLDLERIMDLMRKLWPKADILGNDEQVVVWNLAFGHATHDEVARVLRDHAASSKFAPKPAEIKERLRIEHGEEHRREPAEQHEAPSRWEIQRRQWVKSDPGGPWADMPESDIRRRVLYWEWQQQMAQSGADTPEAEAREAAYQRACDGADTEPSADSRPVIGAERRRCLDLMQGAIGRVEPVTAEEIPF